MKIDRRSFLGLVLGGAAGTALTPLPLKLTDDLSIWTQSFRYLPNEVPVPPDGAVSCQTSVCTLCPGGCGISVRKIEGRAVKIEGRSEYPVNNGGICTLGLAGLQLLYGPWRVKTPFKKKDGRFEKITWDQALTEIGQRLNELRHNGQSRMVAGFAGSGNNTTGRLLQRFLTVFGSPNFVTSPTVEDSLSLAAGRMLGTQATPGFDLENSTYILSFAAGLLDGWGAPVRMFRANSSWKDNGAILVQVEARLSNTAAKADRWIPINPGTEAVLALGLAHIIVREGLYAAGLETDSQAFGDFQQLLNDRYTPGQVAKQTGVDEPKIEKLARDFAAASRPVAVCGRGSGRDPVGGLEAMAVLALNKLTGGINRSGGLQLAAVPDYIKWPAPELDEVAAKELAGPRLDGAGTVEYVDARSMPHRLAQVVNSNAQSPVQALFVSDANPVFTMHDAETVKKAFEKIPLVVSLSAYMDETAALADYVLPAHTYLERHEDVLTTAGLRKPLIGLVRPVVKPVFDTMHPGDVIIALAKHMGGVMAEAFVWKNYDDCLEQTLAESWQALSSQGYLQESPLNAVMKEVTPAVRIDFSALVSAAGKKEVDIRRDGTWPLTLIPYDAMQISGGHIGTPPFVLKTVSDTILKKKDVFIEVNPVTARRHNLSEGGSAMLETPAGKARVRVHVTEGIVPDVIAMPRGLGHSAYDDYLAGKGVNINTLVAPVADPVSGLDVAWGVKAKLTKV